MPGRRGTLALPSAIAYHAPAIKYGV